MAVAGVDVDWDAEARGFDEEPDHGLRDPEVRAAWAERLAAWLPAPAADVLDLGCGTGSLSLLAAEQGHRITGVDRSARMTELARAKFGQAGRQAVFLDGDAAAPPVGERRFDVVLVRHVLWTLPDRVLAHWRELLRPGGRFVLVEGVWGTIAPVGISAGRLTRLLEPLAASVRVERLSDDARLWGKDVDDERYAVVATV
ncbi:class I SAM-dependent methyltransferase [Streptomyces sp. V3I7]|uniref:class I SAM-dependent methyltransferase n=1 Tax=Streptomyces sp. V3I7 TaxID=3042278 RepID=UPI00278760A8|nr:class I SAM-dependent methyltransferase [Streptomyces sp. V3I7]MDQ0990048.1 SAM-dependent methyltransferase [Streptomyces sp. V3I7]